MQKECKYNKLEIKIFIFPSSMISLETFFNFMYALFQLFIKSRYGPII